jgi:transposase-like protein
MNKQENEIKRWTAKRKTQVVLDILKGKTTVAEVSRQHDLTPGEVERWGDCRLFSRYPPNRYR